MTIGTEMVAASVAQAHTDASFESLPGDVELIGSGDQRTVYLHGGVVYKVGDDAVNRYEHKTLTRLRAGGHEHAPETTLYEVRVTDYSLAHLGLTPESVVTVVAMPYLPEDGSVPHEGAMLPGMVDLNPDNVHAHGGQLWLIDAGGL